MNSSDPLNGAKLSFIGCGVMAEAIIAGLLSKNLVNPEQVVGSHPREERREELQGKYGIRLFESNREAVGYHAAPSVNDQEATSAIIILTVKPQRLGVVLGDLREGVQPNQLVISIVAGARIETIADALQHRSIVRAMPNTPAQIGAGMTVWTTASEVSEAQQAQIHAVFGALGREMHVEEERMIDMATALSATGPTYTFLVMEALIDAAVHLGFPRHVAHDLVIETLEGSTLFAKSSGDHPAVLRNMVTSPGGTSAAALHELESGRLRTVLSEAVWAAYRRTVELGEQLESSVPGPGAGA